MTDHIAEIAALKAQLAERDMLIKALNEGPDRRAWTNAVANIRQGQRSPPRCEPPSEFDINIAAEWIEWVERARRAFYVM